MDPSDLSQLLLILAKIGLLVIVLFFAFSLLISTRDKILNDAKTNLGKAQLFSLNGLIIPPSQIQALQMKQFPHSLQAQSCTNLHSL